MRIENHCCRKTRMMSVSFDPLGWNVICTFKRPFIRWPVKWWKINASVSWGVIMKKALFIVGIDIQRRTTSFLPCQEVIEILGQIFHAPRSYVCFYDIFKWKIIALARWGIFEIFLTRVLKKVVFRLYRDNRWYLRRSMIRIRKSLYTRM